MTSKNLKKTLLKKRDKINSIPKENWASSGLTTINLATSGHPDRGLAKGLCYNYVGDSSAGKTWLAFLNMAEIANDPKFDDYEIVFDNAENGALMNVRKYFGNKLADRIRPLGGTRDRPSPSRYLEQFYSRLTDLHDQGKPYICVLDSMDVLVPKADLKNAKKAKQAEASGKEAGGSYGTDKAKINSRELRTASARLPELGSILVLISQTRHSIGWGSQFNPKTMAGGDAIKFYSRLQLWLSVSGTSNEKFGKEKVQKGQFVTAKITKNHLSGWTGTTSFPIFKGVGIDDVGACVDYLVNFGKWSRSSKDRDLTKGKIKGFGVTKTREAMIQYIEANDKEDELRELVKTTWEDIENQTSVKRKKRYE